jgi:hypothetical protein
MLSIRTMSTAADYHRVPTQELRTPAAHIDALTEFAQVVRGG